MSADGKISTKDRVQVKISNDDDLKRVDKLKCGIDAIMVGIGTILADDPSLTVKSGECPNPTRVVVDSRARTPLDAEILHKGDGERIILVSEAAPLERISALSEYAQIVIAGEDQVDLRAGLLELKRQGIDRIMVEGGGTLNWSLFAGGLVDELYTYIGGLVVGGVDAPTLVDGDGFSINESLIPLELIDFKQLGNGVLLRWSVKRV
ncbi:MAG: 5-amino-6-(5-phosphoribosylamino)uracil reductase [Candidatus Syntrophoarchaeum caldarius]|uniref:2,5-diamino-6-(ribosylamino)-4(3H)-pyrimidinone 5'-phosphate reductase n=1 Tax=Candidatus Syntropharchaeum caldarium TaxID=1838285 RepID=A0A1F2PAZ1_9EURY|nr:MAG: 5-amino-6-(5-phosphoribosylamino)uracil reductase [Candidatus Syntrophoarchaeum caldarius]